MVGNQRLTLEQSSVGLKVALQIIKGWRATQGQACKILRISPSTYRRVSQGETAGERLDADQQQRVGLILEIHATLREVFESQRNVTDFPTLKNFNAFFEGRTPLEVMSQGDMLSLYETFKRIEQLKSLDA